MGMVSFLIDTGADSTVLMPLDARRLKVDYTKLTDTDDSLGVGGKSIDFVIPAVLIIPDSDQQVAHAYQFQLRIPQHNPDLRTVPSLLGRDILNRWRMNYHPAKSELTAEIISSDRQFQIS